jgi:hypothetical protein
MIEYITMFKKLKGGDIEQKVIHISEKAKMESDGYCDHVSKVDGEPVKKLRAKKKAKVASNGE